jgi:crossover junction endodeoxyribonuclease RuvC
MVLGIDPSLSATGLAIWPNSEALVLSTVDSKPGDIEPRLLNIIQRVNVTLNQSEPTLVAIEGLAFGSKTGSPAERGALHFGIRMALYLRRIPFIVVAPGALKKFVTGSGTAEKSMVLRDVYKRWGIDAKDDNQADAAGLAYIAAAVEGLWEPTTEAQRQVIDSLKQQDKAKPPKKRGKRKTDVTPASPDNPATSR